MANEETERREQNAYFAELDAIAAKLDEAAKILTPDEGDDGTPPDGTEREESNSYFASFRNIASALARLNVAIAERIGASEEGIIPAERLPAGIASFDIKTPFIDHGGAQLYDNAVNALSLYGPSTAYAYRLPAKTAGKARCFMLCLSMNAATEWTLPQDVAYESDDEGVFDEIEVGTTSVFMFTEIRDNVFLVSRKRNVRSVVKG